MADQIVEKSLDFAAGSAGQAKIDAKADAGDVTTALAGKADASAVSSHTSDTGNPHGVTKSQVGLANVDNTSDANKPVSTATQTALNLKANLASPALTGTPTAPTATAGTSTTQIATTAFVGGAIADLVASSPAALNTLNELAAALGNDANFATTVTTAIAGKQPVDATLTALSGVSTSANKLIYATGSDTFSTTDLSSFGRQLIDDADAAAARSTLGLSNVQNVDQTNATNITLGTLSDDRLSDNVPLLNEDDELVANVVVRKGTEAEINAIVLAEGEFAYTTDTKQIRAGDGVTAGGTTVQAGPKIAYQTLTAADDGFTLEHGGAELLVVTVNAVDEDVALTADSTTPVAAGSYLGQTLAIAWNLIPSSTVSDPGYASVDVGIGRPSADSNTLTHFRGFADAAFDDYTTEGHYVTKLVWVGSHWIRDDGQIEINSSIQASLSPSADTSFCWYGKLGSEYTGSVIAMHGGTANTDRCVAIGSGAVADSSRSWAIGEGASTWQQKQLSWCGSSSVFTASSFQDASTTKVVSPSDDGTTIVIPQGTTVAFAGTVCFKGWKASAGDPLNKVIAWSISGLVTRDNTANVRLVGTPTITLLGADTAVNTVTCTITVDTSLQCLCVNVVTPAGIAGYSAIDIQASMTAYTY